MKIFSTLLIVLLAVPSIFAAQPINDSLDCLAHVSPGLLYEQTLRGDDFKPVPNSKMGMIEAKLKVGDSILTVTGAPISYDKNGIIESFNLYASLNKLGSPIITVYGRKTARIDMQNFEVDGKLFFIQLSCRAKSIIKK